MQNCSDFNQRDDIYEETCLHKVIRCEMWHNLRLLIRADLDVNLQDAQGETALHKAANCSQVMSSDFIADIA